MPRVHRTTLGMALAVCAGLSLSLLAATPQEAAPTNKQTKTLIAYKVDPNVAEKPGEAGTLQGWKVLASKPVPDGKLRDRIEKVLGDKSTYGDQGAKCFQPGMGFTVKSEEGTVDIVICLQCYWLYEYKPGQDEPEQKALSEAGVKQLARLYAEIFPE